MRTLIAIPCFDMMHTSFVKAYSDMLKPGDVAYTFIQGTLIYEARNLIANNAVSCGFDRVLWLDSDMIVPKTALINLQADMDTGKDFVTALYFMRKTQTQPVIYDKLRWYVHPDGNVETERHHYKDYPKSMIFEIAGAGFGCVMTSTDLLKDVIQKFGSPFTPMMGMGEDLAFCWRVTQIGRKMWCDSRIKCGHIGQYVFDESSVKKF